MPGHTRCRACETTLPEPFLDLGGMPLANAFLASPDEFAREPSFPLAVAMCPRCGLAQLTFVVPAEQLYRQYWYVSSTSEAVRRYAIDLAARLVGLHRLTSSDLVIELGSNDGLVLQAFQQHGVRVLGVEPAKNIAALARMHGVPTVEEFFSEGLARTLAHQEGQAAVIVGRHVFAHIDDLHDFFRAVARWLADDGVLLIEVPYFWDLIAQLEFDTIYHEHLSYMSLEPVVWLCARHGFQLIDVERVALHGGSVLLWIRKAGPAATPTARLQAMRDEERQLRLADPEPLSDFSARVSAWKRAFEQAVGALTRAGASMVGYGAAAKASTLLNACPTAANALRYILDQNPLKHGRYTPGTHLRVVPVETWEQDGITHMLILAWNFKDEIMAQMQHFAKRGGRFFIPIPHPHIV